MTADTNTIPLPTLARVLIENPYELRRWCQRLICTEAQLRAAVGNAGSDPEAVRAELKRADKLPRRLLSAGSRR